MPLIKPGDKLKDQQGCVVEVVSIGSDVKVRDQEDEIQWWTKSYVLNRCTLIDPPGDGLTRKLIGRVKQLERELSSYRGKCPMNPCPLVPKKKMAEEDLDALIALFANSSTDWSLLGEEE